MRYERIPDLIITQLGQGNKRLLEKSVADDDQYIDVDHKQGLLRTWKLKNLC